MRQLIKHCLLIFIEVVGLGLIFSIFTSSLFNSRLHVGYIPKATRVWYTCVNDLPVHNDDTKLCDKIMKDFKVNCKKIDKNWLRIEYGKVSLPKNVACTAKGFLFDTFYKVKYNKEVNLTDKAMIPTDSFIANCVNTVTNKTQKMLYAGIKVKDEVVKRKKVSVLTNHTFLGENILMVGVDQTSRLGIMRYMPQALEYLEKELNSVTLKVYNTVGDGTAAAFLGLLTGKLETELPEAHHKGDRYSRTKTCIDVFPWIYKDLHKMGYVTSYSEDQPGVPTFYEFLEYRHPPVDHYFRPYHLTISKFLKNYYCVGSEPQIERELGIVKELFRLYPSNPKFAFFFFGKLSHDLYSIKDLPPYFIDFFKWYKTTIQRNTTLFFFTDHGNRWHNFRQTLQGKYEERLPLMSIVLSQNFKNKYPQFAKNLRRNEKALITPFDIHQTLRDLASLPDYNSKIPVRKRGSSIFRPFASNRTCEDAGILPHFCTCSKVMVIQNADKNPKVIQIAKEFVKFVNKLTNAQRKICAELKLYKIKSAEVTTPRKEVAKFSNSHHGQRVQGQGIEFKNKLEGGIYKVTLQTDPSKAMFEFSVQQYDNALGFEDSSRFAFDKRAISRINAYGSQPKCLSIKYSVMRKYCFCKGAKPNISL